MVSKITEQVWIMSNDLHEHTRFLTNEKWYPCTPETLYDLDGFRLTDDDGDSVFVLESNSKHTISGGWNVRGYDIPASPLNTPTMEVVNGLQKLLDGNFDDYETFTVFIASLVDKLRSGEYTITHKI